MCHFVEVCAIKYLTTKWFSSITIIIRAKDDNSKHCNLLEQFQSTCSQVVYDTIKNRLTDFCECPVVCHRQMGK